MDKPLDDYFKDNVKPPSQEELKRKAKRHALTQAKCHLREFFQKVLESSGKNSIRLEYVSVIIIKTISEMQKEGVFHLKRMQNGKVRIFKKRYCRRSVEDWKKCPEYSCPAWPYGQGSECPHHPHKAEITLEIAEDIVLHEDKKENPPEKQQQEEQRS